MEYEKIFATVGILLIGIIAWGMYFQGWNDSYGQSVSSSANETYARMQSLSQSGLFNMSVATSNATITRSGASVGDGNENLISRALTVITSIPTLLGLVPALLQDFALILGVPIAYSNIASWMFIFSFAVLFAYLLLLGVRRLL